jgi:hypothetical protein
MSDQDFDDSPAKEEVDGLTRLAIKHGTDKWGLHFYTPIYHLLLRRMRRRPVRLLEIGVGGYNLRGVGGASLAMWADYFLNRVCDELGPFDIIIDDGSHVPHHVTTSFNILFPRLQNGGFYMIEDVQTTFWPQFGGSALGGATMRLAMALLENLHHAEIQVAHPTRHIDELSTSIRAFHAYHNLFAIEKGDNTEPSNHRYRLDNPHAARALRFIEQQMERTPTAAGVANMIQLKAVAGNIVPAWTMLEEALTKWPDHPSLLYVGYTIATMSNDLPRRLHYVQRLAALEPDNFWLQGLKQQIQTEALEPAVEQR